MVRDAEPLIRLEPGGQAPILNYNLPEPAIYTGRNFIDLGYDDTVFSGTVDVVLEDPGNEKIAVIKAVRRLTGLGLKEAKELVEAAPQVIRRGVTRSEAEAARDALAEAGATTRIGGLEDTGSQVDDISESLSHEELVAETRHAMRTGFVDRRIFPAVRVASGSVRVSPAGEGPAGVVSTLPVSPQLATLDVEEVASRKERGEELKLYTSMSGAVRYRYVARPRVARPRILLVETYRLATYLGSYGAGPVVKTFSLLPGERTTISIRTFRKTEEERARTSSILDSFSEESAADFEETVANEQTDRASFEESFEYHAEAEAKAGWGWGSASVSGGVKGGTNAAREESAKNTMSATNKHAQKASAKRQVEIDTSDERRETVEQERTTEREIENINVSRTLNYVFRQMNQEFITVLSLVDVRVAFFNGFAGSRDEVALPELHGLLERHVVEEERDRIRADIRDSLGAILDHRGRLHDDFVAEREIDADNRYLRVRTEKTSIYEDPASGTTIEIPGIILSATQNVMRTDGVIVEALLGVGDALDEYATRLQELEVDRLEADLQATRAATAREEVANDVIRDNDAERAELLGRITRHHLTAPLELAVRQRTDDDG